eukprot:CAMPEP_0181199276 /NCGR_PEP_ID=MMETSP1096-20121128/17085_1 /TAXON_ID=156174 ORGANISM="Chrysochromulina ericina, Strain CCMP281" /NCGR_SAMPLE_ID=MMETSP1096 /ASSEMBLY_ACC=CAM_ASM_000453 /LENGTH=237 /DNA_ID=CAMNT_0023289437 /DNA_START=4 /DNA_END=717 /DNA_ORIENTATION=-
MTDFATPSGWFVSNGGKKVQRTVYDAFSGCAGNDISEDEMTVTYTANGVLKLIVGLAEAGKPLSQARAWGVDLNTGNFLQSSSAADEPGASCTFLPDPEAAVLAGKSLRVRALTVDGQRVFEAKVGAGEWMRAAGVQLDGPVRPWVLSGSSFVVTLVKVERPESASPPTPEASPQLEVQSGSDALVSTPPSSAVLRNVDQDVDEERRIKALEATPSASLGSSPILLLGRCLPCIALA